MLTYMEKKTKHLSVRLTKSDYAKVEEMAWADDRSVSQWVERLLKFEIWKHEDAKKIVEKLVS